MTGLGLIIGLLAAAIVLGSFFVLKRQISSSVGAEKEALLKRIPELLAEVEALLAQRSRYGSKPQLDGLLAQAANIQSDLEKEKESLKTIEGRLETAQRDVEAKEAAQQELKTSREEEEQQLEELLARFNNVSTESVALEQRLAASMKSLDQLLSEVELTDDQRGMFDELSNALTAASARLRDLLFEYNTVKDRLEALRQQHKDLEEEYTRLVEQQLGE